MEKPHLGEIRKTVYANKNVKSFLVKRADDPNINDFLEHVVLLVYTEKMQTYFEDINLEYPEADKILNSLGL